MTESLQGLFYWFPAFIVSTTFHEAAHAWAAMLGGDLTAYRGGQVSLNPIPHIRREPFGMLILPLVTSLTSGWAMGWASAPYDPAWADRHPQRAAWMAAAGPGANLSLALMAFVVLKLGLAAHVFGVPESVSLSRLVATPDGAMRIVGTALSVLLSLNLMLAVFNLLPLPPLDGSSAIGLVLPSVARMLRGSGGLLAIAGIFVAWKVFPMIVPHVLDVLLMLLHPGVRYGR